MQPNRPEAGWGILGLRINEQLAAGNFSVTGEVLEIDADGFASEFAKLLVSAGVVGIERSTCWDVGVESDILLTFTDGTQCRLFGDVLMHMVKE